jgi:hypothetical protein
MPCNPLVREVPQGLTRFNLTNLNLSLCGLQEVSFFERGTCPNLRLLDLSWNRIAEMEPLCGLLQLRELNLTGNWLTIVPQRMTQLQQLLKLHLSNNQLRRCCDLTALEQLVFVSFTRNRQLPPDCARVCDTPATTRALVARVAHRYHAERAVFTFVLCWKNRHLSEDEHRLLQRLPRDMARYLAKTIWKMR